jgi:hypothetical protein
LNGRLRTHAQVINYSHLFPTRYAFELEGLKGTVSSDTFKEPSQREDSKKNIKKQLEERYQNGKNKWFFQPLRVRCLTFAPVGFGADGYLIFPDSSDCTLSTVQYIKIPLHVYTMTITRT